MDSVKKRSSAFHKYSQILVLLYRIHTSYTRKQVPRKFGFEKNPENHPPRHQIFEIWIRTFVSPPILRGKWKRHTPQKSTKGTFPLYLSCPLPIGLFFFLLRLVGDWALGASPGFWASPLSADSNEAIRFWGMGKKKKKEAGGHSGFGGWSSPCSAKDVSFICCVGVKFPEFSLFSLLPPSFPLPWECN